MNILGIFKRNKAPTASLAKERLKIIVEHSRSDAKRPEFLNEMRLEILEVVKKYVEIDIDDINTNINQRGETEMLELNILLPDTVDIEKKHKASMAQAPQKSEQSAKVDSAKTTEAESLAKKAQQVVTKATEKVAEKVDEKIDTSLDTSSVAKATAEKVSDVAASAKSAMTTEKHNDEVSASATDEPSESKETSTKSDAEARLKKAHEELRSLADKSVAPELKKEIPSRTVPRQLKSVNSNKSSR